LHITFHFHFPSLFNFHFPLYLPLLLPFLLLEARFLGEGCPPEDDGKINVSLVEDKIDGSLHYP
jgi:hypothetical protein